MNSSLHHQKSINVLLLGSFLSTLGIFIAVPLMGIHAVEFFKLTPSQIGMLASIWPITVFSMSFFAGMHSDRWGHLRVIRLALLLYFIAFMLMALAPNIRLFSLGLFIFGLGKAFFDSSMRAAMTCVSAEAEREKYFRLRYLLQNIGCVLGPLVGVWAYKVYSGLSFSLTAFCSLAFFALTVVLLKEKDFLASSAAEKKSFMNCLSVFKNPHFVRWILSGTLILMAYGAIEALMPSVISMSAGERPNFGLIVSLNAATVIVLQGFLLSFFRKTSLTTSLSLGTLLMVLGFQLFIVEQNAYFMSIIGTICYSAGESLLFPCFEVLIDRIAPKNRKALYFGAGEVKQIGFFIGPMFGGFLLEHQGSAALFIACGVCSALSGALLFSVRKSDVNINYALTENSIAL